MDVELRRRDLLRAGAVVAGGVLLGTRVPRAETAHALPEVAVRALAKSRYVYISPLSPTGKESSCHGEVWFFEDHGDAVIATARDAWKTRALEKGWSEARVWVADVDPGGEKFRGAPEFKARATRDADAAVFDRLMASFAKKYPDGWEKWEPRFRKGYSDGSRVVIRYTPIGS